MATTLYCNGRIHTRAARDATALLVEGERIAWIGAADAVPVDADEIIDLAGAWLAPAFVDAHVHATSTGLALTGLDLSSADSLGAALDALRHHAAGQPDGVVLGTGWDETRWPERRPPTAAEVEAAAPGRAVYLARIDVHSAVVSPVLLPVAAGSDGYDESGWLRRDAHHEVRRAAYGEVDDDQRRRVQQATRAEAARLGIGCFHELAGPAISGLDDCRALMQLARDEPGPDVIAYWGELDGITTAVELGVLGAAGDLFVDGAIGSRTAALHAEYADDAGNRGALYHDVDAIARHVEACTRAGLQAGFHVIGDRAVDTVLDGFRVAAERVGDAAIRAARHRLEHVEMITDVDALARFGIVASVQPAFDALWGGGDGMYATRLGSDRGTALNPFAAMAAAGVVLAFGSDAPVTPLDPWGTVRAAVRHHTAGAGITARAAFAAHTRGGWRAAGIDNRGELVPEAPATFAVWDVGDLLVQAPDPRVVQWSTDPPAGTLPLPDVDAPPPQCLRTVVRGGTVFAA